MEIHLVRRRKTHDVYRASRGVAHPVDSLDVRIPHLCGVVLRRFHAPARVGHVSLENAVRLRHRIESGRADHAEIQNGGVFRTGGIFSLYPLASVLFHISWTVAQ